MAGQLVKRGRDVWLVRVYLGRDGAGKRKWHNHTVHGRKEDAQRYLTGYLRDRDLGRYAGPTRMTLDELLDRHLKQVARSRAVTTWQNYRDFCRRYVRPALGHVRLDRLNTWDIQAFYDRMREEVGLAPTTLNTLHIALSSALSQAVKWKLLPENPARGTVRPSVPKKAAGAVVLTPEKVLRLVEGLQASRWGVALELALATGARPEEYMGLTWPCVDWREDQVRIERTLVWLRGTPEERALLEQARPDLRGKAFSLAELPKTTSGRRAIALPPTLMERLREHRRRQMEAQGRAGARYERHDLVFCTPLGRPVRSSCVARSFKGVLRRLDLPTMCLYDLRRSLATLLLMSGEHVKVIAEILGHSGVHLAQDTYAQLLPTMQRQAACRMEVILYGRGRSEA